MPEVVSEGHPGEILEAIPYLEEFRLDFLEGSWKGFCEELPWKRLQKFTVQSLGGFQIKSLVEFPTGSLKKFSKNTHKGSLKEGFAKKYFEEFLEAC